jgi:hypothetical protein
MRAGPDDFDCMEKPAEQAVYRVRTVHRRDAMQKGYRHTREVVDDHTGQVVATCNVVGRPAFATLEIIDAQGRTWRMQPDRKLMPSRWIVTDPHQRVAMQFDQKIVGKLANPLYKCALALLDGEGREVYRLLDPRTNVPDRIFGTGPREWIIADGDRLAAKLVRLPRKEKKAGGLRGVLRKLASTSEPGIVSVGAAHLLPAPVALGMVIIFAVVTDPS